MALLLLYVGFALGVSFLCSLLEAALLSARAARLAERAGGSRGVRRLVHFKQERVDDAITATLVLNTVSHTLGATLAGAQAARVFGSAWVGLFSGVLTLLILIFSEVIPKTLGAVYAETLAPFVGNVLAALTHLMVPVLVLTRGLTRLLTRGKQETISRGEVAAVIAMASRHGTISGQELTFLSSFLRSGDIPVSDVMTPRTVMVMMQADATVGDLLANREAEAFSRIPLYRESRDDVLGYVLQREVLKAAAESGDLTQPLSRYLRSIDFVPEFVSVARSLRRFLERREPLAAVTDEHGGVSGLLTLEDITETILGVEIVDESDRVVDLRQAAAALRDRRLARLHPPQP